MLWKQVGISRLGGSIPQCIVENGILGISQVVRHRTLIPAYGGSTPPSPAKYCAGSSEAEQGALNSKVGISKFPRHTNLGLLSQMDNTGACVIPRQ